MNSIEFILKVAFFTLAYRTLQDNNITPTNLDWWTIAIGFIGGSLIGQGEFQLGDWMFE